MAGKTPKNEQNSAAGMMTLQQAATLLMVSDQWVRDLSKKGYVPAPDRGMVPLVATVQGYIRWLKDEERRTSKTAAASAVQQARAKEIELRIARETGELISMVSAEETFAEVLSVYRQRLAGVPAAVTRDLALRDLIDRELEAAIADCREQFRLRKEELLAGSKKGRR